MMKLSSAHVTFAHYALVLLLGAASIQVTSSFLVAAPVAVAAPAAAAAQKNKNCVTTTGSISARTTTIAPLFGFRDELSEGRRKKDTSNTPSAAEADYGNDVMLQRPKERGLTIPIVQSVPGTLPLMMGAEVFLDPPTLGQWQALEESVTLHKNYLQGSNLTAIDAAPLVAVMDEYTGAVERPGSKLVNEKRRYATIAAVVGISASQKVPDEKSFMEIMLGCRNTVQPLSSKIRLVGVGRAELTDFFYQIPTLLEEEEECLLDDEDEDDLPPPIFADEDREDPIVMAEFRTIDDDVKSSIHSMQNIGTKGARSPLMAPVFAIHEMSKYSNKVTRLHDDRRRLVNLLASAKARLAECNVFDDADGIGSIFAFHLLEENMLDETERLLQCDNYGLNYYSSFSSILDLTGVAEGVLQNYYSPQRRDTEEYRLEVLSFVAFRSLQGYCSPEDLAWALTCNNSIERLHRAYDLMLDHFWSLKDMVKEANADLVALGEDGCSLNDMHG